MTVTIIVDSLLPITVEHARMMTDALAIWHKQRTLSNKRVEFVAVNLQRLFASNNIADPPNIEAIRMFLKSLRDNGYFTSHNGIMLQLTEKGRSWLKDHWEEIKVWAVKAGRIRNG